MTIIVETVHLIDKYKSSTTSRIMMYKLGKLVGSSKHVTMLIMHIKVVYKINDTVAKPILAFLVMF